MTDLSKKIDAIKQRAITSSYGLRLLRTASGQREITAKSTEKIDVSTLKILDPVVLCKENSKVLGAGRFGECVTATFHQYVVCIKTMNESGDA